MRNGNHLTFRMILAAFKVISSGSPGPTPTAYNVPVINSITFSIRNASKLLRLSPSLNHPVTVTCFSKYTVYSGKCHHLDITVPACPLLHIMLHPGKPPYASPGHRFPRTLSIPEPPPWYCSLKSDRSIRCVPAHPKYPAGNPP